MSNIASQLKRAREGWREVATPEGGGGSNLPPGRYKVEIDAGTCVRTDKNGGVGILWKFKVIDGEEEGRFQVKWAGLLDKEGDMLPEDRIKWTKRDFATLLGEPLDDISTVEDVVTDLIGKTTEIEVKMGGANKEFTNIYITDEAVDPDGDDEPAPKRKRDEDEDEDPPRKNRGSRDESDDVVDEDEPAPKKGKKDDEDDEDEVRRLLAKNKTRRK